MVPKGSKYSLKGFIVEKISMSHIYQPAMLKVLLEKVLSFVAPVSGEERHAPAVRAVAS